MFSLEVAPPLDADAGVSLSLSEASVSIVSSLLAAELCSMALIFVLFL